MIHLPFRFFGEALPKKMQLASFPICGRRIVDSKTMVYSIDQFLGS